VHISHSPTDGKKPPKTDAQLNREDACVLHWQYLFEALRRLFGEGDGDTTDDGSSSTGGNSSSSGSGSGSSSSTSSSTSSSDGKKGRPKTHKLQLFVFQQSCGSGGMWLWLNDPLYEQTYRCSEWPLFVAYTAEPETNAVGASWQVFYSCLERVLGAGADSDTSGSSTVHSTSSEGIPGIIRDSEEGALSRGIEGVGVGDEVGDIVKGDEDALVASLSPPPATTLSSFYAAVARQYYRIEPTIYRVNFDLTEEQRKAMFCARFGVLGTAAGRRGGLDQQCVRSFFGAQ
jgi:hypothetical protein